MERKLASIVKIDKIKPHLNADSLELAMIGGWQVVVKIGEFKAGDLCVYCEIDSVMPQRPEFEFLAPRKYRIKTTKLRGQISQGIIFPLSILDMLDDEGIGLTDFFEPGDDVTEVLGVTKYDPPIPACLSGVAAGNFPSHSIKTDEERIQNLADQYEYYRKWYIWTATEKLDGSSCTYTLYDDKFGVSSRNLELLETEGNSFWKYARSQDIEAKMRAFVKRYNLKSLTMQGELVGEGIQGNKYKLKGQEVRFFRIFDPQTYTFYGITKAIEIIKDMELIMVPIVETDMTLPETLEELLAYADGISKLRDTKREGIVFVAEQALPGTDVETGEEARPLSDYQGRLSFKVISNKFILKHDL